MARQAAALDAQTKQVDGALKMDAADRAARIRAVDERRAAGVALCGAGDALLQRIRGSSPAVPPVRLPPGLLAGLQHTPTAAPAATPPSPAVPSPVASPAPTAASPVASPAPTAASPAVPAARRVTTGSGRTILVPDRLLRDLGRHRPENPPQPPPERPRGSTSAREDQVSTFPPDSSGSA
jgi:hypothetical protein